jgi:nucleoside-diphosphate-sugar epimerase
MSEPITNTPVLVTGISGFIALHCAAELLEKGYPVRGTLRSPDRADSIRKTLGKNADLKDRLEFVTADLTKDEGWLEAVQNCEYVLHVASPLPRQPPKHEDELVIPARDGALRVLTAAKRAGVKRVVMTSSIATVTLGQPLTPGRVFDEKDWTNPNNVSAYEKSKTLAERAAWEYVKALPDDQNLELVTINPGYVFGPILDEDHGTSNEVFRKMMSRELPGLPNVGFMLVDVRDVAHAHILAMTTPAAAGKRFCCVSEFVWIHDLARLLDEYVRPKGYKIPQRKLPDFVVKLVAVFDKTTRLIVDYLGERREVSNELIKGVLSWQPRDFRETVTATADSLIEHGVVRAR